MTKEIDVQERTQGKVNFEDLEAKLDTEGTPEGTEVTNLWDNLSEDDAPPSLEAKSEEEEDAEEVDENKEDDEDEEAEEESDDEDEEEIDDEEDDTEDEEEESDDEGADEEPDKEARVFNVRNPDGETVKLSGDAEVKVKINGKFRRVKVQDLVTDKAGEVAWGEKIEEVKGLTKKFKVELAKREAEDKEVDYYVKNMVSAAESNDIYGAMEMLAGMVKQDPDKMVETFLTSFENFYVDFASKTPAERKAYVLERRNQSAEKRLEMRRKGEHTAQAVSQISAQVAKVQEETGLSREELRDSYQTLAQDAQSRGQSIEGIQLKNVVDLAVGTRILTNVDEALDSLGEAEVSEEFRFYVFDLAKAANTAGKKLDTLSDYEALVKQAKEHSGVATGPAAQNLERKVSKRPTKKTSRKAKKKKQATLSSATSIEDAWSSV